jgi:cell shape-determining protein MreC
MSKIKLPLFLFGVVVISLVGFFLIRGNNKADQIVYEDTLSISKEYLALRYKTDNVLTNAKEYESYDAWNEEMNSIVQAWEDLESKVLKLEENAGEMSKETNAFNLVKSICLRY